PGKAVGSGRVAAEQDVRGIEVDTRDRAVAVAGGGGQRDRRRRRERRAAGRRRQRDRRRHVVRRRAGGLERPHQTFIRDERHRLRDDLPVIGRPRLQRRQRIAAVVGRVLARPELLV